jgi:hypothetical protein
MEHIHSLKVNGWIPKPKDRTQQGKPQRSKSFSSSLLGFDSNVHFKASNVTAKEKDCIRMFRSKLETECDIYNGQNMPKSIIRSSGSSKGNENNNNINIVEEEKEAVQRLRNYVTDSILQHFLIARNYNLEKSYEMLVKALHWRLKRNPDRYFPIPIPIHKQTQSLGTCTGTCTGTGTVPVIFNSSENEKKIEKENRTGKIYIAGKCGTEWSGVG